MCHPLHTHASILYVQIDQLFVHPIGGDGKPVLESYTGAYAVKIMINGKWQVVIVDDFFPALDPSQASDDNKGLAVGHSYGESELWVSLLEKARHRKHPCTHMHTPPTIAPTQVEKCTDQALSGVKI